MARRDKMEVDNLDARPQFTFQNLTGADRTDSPILDLLNSVGHSTTTMPQQATIGSSHPPTPAQQVLNDLTPIRRKIIECILDGDLGVLPQADRDRVQRLFEILDITKDGRISEKDFDHHFPAVKQALHNVWDFLVDQFDFNDDKVIEPHEFVGHFVIYAAYFMHIQASSSQARNLVDLFVEWENTFLRNFRQRVSEIEALVREAGHDI